MKLRCTALALTLLVAACGDDDQTETSAETTTTTAPTTTSSTTSTTEAADADAEAVAAAVAIVFDSSVPFDEKVSFIEGGEGHRGDHEAYLGAADGVGGITVQPTDVTVDGDIATVTYAVSFAGTQVYDGLTMTAVRSGDSWIVPTTSFCDFLAAARTPCAA